MLDSVKKLMPAGAKRAIRSLLYSRHMTLPPTPRAFLFLAADYGNIGDLAITAAQRRFLSQVAPGHQVVPVPISVTRDVIRSLRRQVAPNDIVTTVGGGNMGSLYPDIEELRQLVIRSFPRNRLICFPQTLDWDECETSRRALERIARVYSGHPDLHLFARETVSFARLKEVFAGHTSVKVRLVPDIVLSATARDLGARAVSAPRGALLCLRDDRERSLEDEHRDALQRALADAGLQTEATDTHAGGARLASEHCAQLLADKLTQFQGVRLVVTDRLHGMILAALAGTPCLVLPNSNHKIRQTWQDWLADVPQVRFLSLAELPTVGAVVQELLAVFRRDPASTVIDPSRYAALIAALQDR